MKRSLSLLALAAALAASGAAAEEYPEPGSRIQFMVPLSPGGTTDTWARLLADALSSSTGAKFQVVNNTSAGGLATYYAVIDNPKDTSQVSNLNIPSALKYLYPNTQAKFNRDSFAPVACSGYTPNVLVVHSDSPYKTLDDLVKAARAKPGTVNAAADGALSDDAVAYANFEKAANVDVNVVIVKGSAQKVTELLAKRIDFFTGGITGVHSQIKSGDFRVLATLSDQRSEFLKDVPTAIEQGVKLTSDSYFCMTMGAGAPEEARAALEAAVQKVAADPAYKKANADVGMQVRFLNGKEMAKVWKEQEQTVKEVLPLLK